MPQLNTVRTCGQVHALGEHWTTTKCGVDLANRGMAWAKAGQMSTPFTMASRAG